MSVAPRWSFDDNPVWFVVLLGFVPIWSVLYFGAGHWLLHRGPVYAHVHSWHHRNMNIGPWSGLSMHPLEHVVLYSDILLFLVPPSSGVHMLFALMHHTIGAPMSHTGYDAVRLRGGSASSWATSTTSSITASSSATTAGSSRPSTS